MRKKGSVQGFIATKMFGLAEYIYCTDGEWHPRPLVGPGGYCAKVYKTIGGFKRAKLGNVDAKWIVE